MLGNNYKTDRWKMIQQPILHLRESLRNLLCSIPYLNIISKNFKKNWGSCSTTCHLCYLSPERTAACWRFSTSPCPLLHLLWFFKKKEMARSGQWRYTFTARSSTMDLQGLFTNESLVALIYWRVLPPWRFSINLTLWRAEGGRIDGWY